MEKAKIIIGFLLGLIVFLMLAGLNVLVVVGVLWEFTVSTKEPQWIGMISSVLATLFFDLLWAYEILDSKLSKY